MLLVALLACVVVARVAIVFVVQSPLHTALLWAALLGVLGLGLLLGWRDADKAHGFVCLVLGTDALIQSARTGISGVHLAAALCWAALAIGTGLYVLRSAAVRRFCDGQQTGRAEP